MTSSDIPDWAALPAALLLIIGGLLTLIGGIGLVKLPDFFSRIHAPSMGNTLGMGCVLLASMITWSALQRNIVIHELLITAFIIITAPITAMLLMRAAVRRSMAAKKARTP